MTLRSLKESCDRLHPRWKAWKLAKEKEGGAFDGGREAGGSRYTCGFCRREPRIYQ